MKNNIAIFTTASLPWMTGTAVNPLFRAAYLSKSGEWEVTLLIPWLSLKDQELVYPNKITFSSPLDQEQYVRNWLEERTEFPSRFSIRFYPGKVIRLSAATQDLPRSIVCNVHGVNPKFLEIGKVKLGKQQRGEAAFTNGVYYIGKMVWSKGYRELLQLLSDNQDELSALKVDLYGSGEDSDQVQEAAKRLKLEVRVNPGRDHANPIFHDYKVFLNPSTSDVVCTTTAEALAMGKIVICANHPSNEFFKQFPNCHVYNNPQEFVKFTLNALDEDPVPLSDDQRHALSWEAATERFESAAGLHAVVNNVRTVSAFPNNFEHLKLQKSVEEVSAILHQAVSGIEVARRALGAIPKSLKPDPQQCLELGLDLSERKPLLNY